LPLFQQARDHPAFAVAKFLLAKAFEDFTDAHISRFFNFLVRVDKRQGKPRAQPAAYSCFPYAHHADQHDGPIVGGLRGFAVCLHDARGYTASRARVKTTSCFLGRRWGAQRHS
jgi:hypothetical protein